MIMFLLYVYEFKKELKLEKMRQQTKRMELERRALEAKIARKEERKRQRDEEQEPNMSNFFPSQEELEQKEQTAEELQQK